jgi:hypothetical protein
LLFSAKVVIGDLDVPGAEAVVSAITKDGGCVIFDSLPDVTISRLRLPLLVHLRKAVATKCNVVSWDDQLSLFELAFEKYGAVDIVVRILLSTVSFPVLSRTLTIIDPKRRNHRN